MKKVIVILMILTALAAAEDFKRHAFTVSGGIPGFLIPELAYEYSIDASNKIGISAGSIVLWPEYRLSYTRMMRSFELMGSIGHVPTADSSDSNFLSDIFEEILSGGTEGCTFVSATGGYRFTADMGFIFRAAAGGAVFVGDDGSAVVPFVQLGIGFGF